MLTVFGSIMLTMTTTAPRLAIGPDTVIGENFALLPGGRGATQALAAHKAGTKVRLAALIGKDAFGDVALTTLKENGVDLTHVQRAQTPTGLSMTVRDTQGQSQHILGLGSNAVITADDLPEAWVDRWTTLLVQAEINPKAMMQAVERVKMAEGKCILHLAPLIPVNESLLDAVDYLILNETEATELAASFAMRTDSPQAMAYDIGARRRGPVLIIGHHLDLYIGLGARVEHIPPPAVDMVDPMGADDALVGVFAAGIAQGAPIADVVHYAVAAAALTASKEGLQMALPVADDIQALAHDWPTRQEPAKPSLRRRPVA